MTSVSVNTIHVVFVHQALPYARLIRGLGFGLFVSAFLFCFVTDRFAAISNSRQDDELPKPVAKTSAHYTRAVTNLARWYDKTD
jgi:hypothetical protein